MRPKRCALRPAWTLRYALLPLCGALFALTEDIPSTGALRTLAQGGIVVLVIGLAAAWIRVNRCALGRASSDSTMKAQAREISIETKTPAPRVIHIEPRRSCVEG
jgi:hypothetical protein